MIINRYRHPFLFYGLSTTIPWGFWFGAAYVSHISPTNDLLGAVVGILGVLGLLGPTVIAFAMIWPHPEMREDLKRRIIDLKGIGITYGVLTCCL